LLELELYQLLLGLGGVQELLLSHWLHPSFFQPRLKIGLHHTPTAEAIFGDGLAIDLVGDWRVLGAIVRTFIPSDCLHNLINRELGIAKRSVVSGPRSRRFLSSGNTQPLSSDISLRPAKVFTSDVPSLDSGVK